MPPTSDLDAKVTQRRRRRKPKPDAAGAACDKENLTIVKKTKDVVSSSNDDMYSYSDIVFPSVALDSSSDVASALRSFNESLKRVGPVESYFPYCPPGLFECIVQASRTLSSVSATFLLQEHASSLLKACRKLVKEAATVDAHFIAVHLLRAITCTLDRDSIDQIETCIRLAYHIITGCSDKGLQATDVVLAGYEALSKLLRKMRCRGGRGDGIQFIEHDAFCLPQVCHAQELPSKQGLKNFCQILKMAMHPTLCLAMVLGKFSTNKKNQQESRAGASFGVWVQQRIEQVTSTNHPYEIARQLLLTVYRPWLSFAVSQTPKDETVPGYCRSAHKFLWDAARMLSKLPHANEGAKESVCLSLRTDAVLMLVPHPSVDCSLWEAGCSYAWKAASDYCRTSNLSTFPAASNQPLLRFHEIIGSVLDKGASQRKKEGMPMAYLEYNTHRLLHTGVESPAPVHGDETDSMVVLWSVVRMGVICRRDIKEGEAPSQTEQEKIVGCLESSTAAFEALFISQVAEISHSTCMQAFQLLAVLSLHKLMYTSVKDKTWEGHEVSLQVAAVLSSRCIGPFALSLARCSSTAILDKPMLYAVGFESFTRAMFSLEALSETDDAELAGLSGQLLDEVMRDMTEQITGYDDLPLESLQKCANALSTLSKNHGKKDREKESILAQLSSILIYKKMEQHVDFSAQRQLSTRMARLGESLYKNSALQEAMLTFASSLELERQSTKNEISRNLSSSRLIEVLACQSKQVILPSSYLESPAVPTSCVIICLLQRLAKAIVAYVGDTEEWDSTMTSANRPFTCDVFQLLAESIFLDRSPVEMVQTTANGAPLGLISVVVDTLVMKGADGLPTLESVYRGVQLWNAVGLELVRKECAASLQRLHTFFKSWIASMLWEVRDLLPIQMSVCEVIIDITGATTLLPEKNIFLLWSETGFTPKIPGPGWIDMYLFDDKPTGCNSLFASCLAILRELLGSTVKGDLLQRGRTIPQVLLNTYDTCMKLVEAFNVDEVLPFERDCLLWTMAQITIFLDYHGDTTRGEDITKLYIPMTSKTNYTISLWAQTKLNMYYLDPLSSAEIAQAAPIEGDLPDCNAETPALTWCDHENLIRTDLVLSGALLHYARQNSLPRQDNEMFWSNCDRFEAQFSCQSTDHPTSAWTKWVMSSVELIRAAEALRQGHHVLYLRHVTKCNEMCQSILQKRTVRGSNSWMVDLTFPSVLSMARERSARAFITKSKFSVHTGDRRQASKYIDSLLSHCRQNSPVKIMTSKSLEAPRVVSCLSSCDVSMAKVLREQARFQASCSALDATIDSFLSFSDPAEEMFGNDDNDSMHHRISMENELAVGDMLYGVCLGADLDPVYSFFYEAAINREKKFHLCTATPSAATLLRTVRLLLCRKLEPSATVNVETIVREVINHSNSRSIEKAWANYYLGSIRIDQAKSTGALQLLWGESSESTEKDDLGHSVEIMAARKCLREAARLHIPDGTDVLTRNILRSLALVYGPHGELTSQTSAGYLILSSVGQAWRQKVLRSFGEAGQASAKSATLLESLDIFSGRINSGSHHEQATKKFLSAFAEVIPFDWKFVAPTLCPSGELLVTSLEKSRVSEKIVMTTTCSFPNPGQSLYNAIVKPLDAIIHRSQEQLVGLDPSAISEQYSKDKTKRAWWSERRSIDSDLQEFLGAIQQDFFPHIHVSCDQRLKESIYDEEEIGDLPCGDLFSKFEAAAYPEDVDQDNCDSLQKLTVSELKNRLRDFGLADAKLRKLRKQQLVDELIHFLRGEKRKETQRYSPIQQGPGSCLFLILDENLTRVPFESLPSLEGRSVCRVPSLALVHSILVERGAQSGICTLDPSVSSSVLDPQNNLKATRDRIQPTIEGITSKNDWSWNSCYGEIPSSSFVSDCLQRNGLFLYFGHGEGKVCYSRKQVESLMETERSCEATIVLMGCSSGKLESVNRKTSKTTDQIPLHFEPEGIAMTYLCAGSPCVVGNLWDVTDHDIDRFTTHLLEDFLCNDSTSKSLAASVAEARLACKMRYIVGGAPVCYGVPVFIEPQ